MNYIYKFSNKARFFLLYRKIINISVKLFELYASIYMRHGRFSVITDA